MKSIILTTLFFLLVTTAFSQKIDFQEGGVSFHLSVNGSLSYDISSGQKILNDPNGRPLSVGNVRIIHDYTGKPSRIGSIMIIYGYNGKVSNVGGMKILYGYDGSVSQTIGAVGGSSGSSSSSSSSSGSSTTSTYTLNTNTESNNLTDLKEKLEKDPMHQELLKTGAGIKARYEKIANKDIAIPNGWHEVEVIGHLGSIQHSRVYVNNGCIAAFMTDKIIVQVFYVGTIQKGKGYFKYYNFATHYNSKNVNQTYSTNPYEVYFINYLEHKTFSKFTESVGNITFTSEENKIKKGKTSIEIFARKISDSDESGYYKYVGVISSEDRKCTFKAIPDTYVVLFLVRSKKKRWITSYQNYTVTNSEQTINLTL